MARIIYDNKQPAPVDTNIIEKLIEIPAHTITKYVLNGKEYDEYQDARIAQMWLTKERIRCPNCDGAGGRNDLQDEDGRKPPKWFECKKCNGRGHLDLKQVYQ